MFENVDELSKTLPRPALTGDPIHDAEVQRRYIANAGIMRSAAFACIFRSMGKALGNAWRPLAAIGHMHHSRHA